MYQSKVTLSKKLILENVPQEQIFERYLGYFPRLNKDFPNPLRDDTSAGCRFYYSPSTDMLKFKDFSTGWNWDCFNVVEFIYKCTFKESLEIIARDFRINGIPDYEYTKKEYTPREKEKFILTAKIAKDFGKEDLKFWNRWEIDKKILNFFNVKSLDFVYFNGAMTNRYSDSNLLYGYYTNDSFLYKVYLPLKKKPYPRFYNPSTDWLQGYEQLPKEGKELVITKSLKDVMVLYKFGIPAISTLSESVILTEEQFTELYNRFDNIYTLMDRDRAGMINAIKHRDLYSIPALLYTKQDKIIGVKDTADCYERLGYQDILDRIEYLKKINY